MALENRKVNRRIFKKTGSDKDRMADDKLAKISSSFASNAHIDFPESPDATEALLYAIQGVEEVIVFFDGDDAGQSAAKEVKEMADRVGLSSKNVALKDTDPGALPLKSVQTLKSKIYA